MVLTSSTNLYNYSKYIVGQGSPYTTIQGAINAANAAGGGTIVIRPGAYVENLTLYDKIDIIGAEGEELTGNIIITGIHLPPNAGNISFKNLSLRSATHILNSAGAGVTNIFLEDIDTIVANGYVFNLPNWTGTLYASRCMLVGTQNGVINNTTAATIAFDNSTIGAGVGNTMQVSGMAKFSDVEILCPASYTGTASVMLKNSYANRNTTFSGNAAGLLINTHLATDAAIALTTTSAGLVSLSDVAINSSAPEVITGTGTVEFGAVTYLTNTAVAATIVRDFTARFETGVLKLSDTTAGVLTATAGVVNAGSPLGVTYGGLGLSTCTTGDIPYGSAPDTYLDLVFVATATRYLSNTGGAATIPAWSQVDLSNGVSGTLPVTNGGLGVASPTDHSILVGSGAAAVTPLSVGGTGVILQGVAGADPSWSTAAYPSTAAVGDILYGSALNTVTGLAFVATATRYLKNTGTGATLPEWGQVDLSNGVTGTLSEGNGGLGIANPTDHSILVGSGAAAITPISAGATGELLTGVTGADPAFATSSTGDFTFTSATAAQLRTLTVSNTDATGANYSAANLLVVAQSASSGDPFVRLNINGGQTYSFGPDNSDSDKLKITDNINPSSGNTLWSMTSAGENLIPQQPAFLAYFTNATINLTGDGTVINPIIFDLETFDQNADYNTGTGVFTAPITGQYTFNASLAMNNIAAGHTKVDFAVVTTGGNFRLCDMSAGACRTVDNLFTAEASCLAHMTAGDTAHIQGYVSGGAQTIGFQNLYESYFSGKLEC